MAQIHISRRRVCEGRCGLDVDETCFGPVRRYRIVGPRCVGDEYDYCSKAAKQDSANGWQLELLGDGSGVVPEADPEWQRIGEGLKRIRMELRMGLCEYAEKIGQLPSTYSDIEHGRRDPIAWIKSWSEPDQV